MNYTGPLNFRIRLRQDTAENWREHNPIPREGEIISAVNSNSVGYKVGDGVRRYRDLPFVGLESALQDGHIYSFHNGRSITVSIDAGRCNEETIEIDEKRLEEILCGIS